MNYREFKIKSVNRDPDALWLGELDVFKVMDSLTPSVNQKEVSADRVLEKWKAESEWDTGDKSVKITTGVRDGLRGVWKALRPNVDHIWVPSDVYPVYRELIPEALNYEMMTEQWSGIFERTGKQDAILLPAPLHPIGRPLTGDEESLMLEWLEYNSRAWLIVDAAYDYEMRNFLHERCIVLRTMSKSWLCRRMFGVLEGRADLVSEVAGLTPAKEQLSYCYESLESQNIPKIQRKLFAEAWSRVGGLLSEFEIDFDPPQTGYLAIADARGLAENPEIITIPATVFGSVTEKQIISCLGGIEL